MGQVSAKGYIFDDYEEFTEWFEREFDFCFWYKGIEYYAGYFTKSKRYGRENGCYFDNIDCKPLHMKKLLKNSLKPLF